ncbi:DNA polymerase alpha subunit B isoform X2 [Apteryx mantelli]|uniref:DNA polymerase alpha subunit B n=1 Tax=Apteryx mantelli TaxID=2696672 RepID=A0ABM4G158_9AVES
MAAAEAAEPVSAEAVLRELGLFELRCDGEDVSAKLVELCLVHGLGPVALANELLAFVTSKDWGPLLTAAGLAAFEHEVLAKRGRKIPRRPDNRYAGLRDIHSLQELLDEDEEEELLDAYATPSKDSRKRGGSTPENPRPKRTLSARSPYALFSPSSFSPSATPSQKYASRGGRGEVVASFGAAQGPSWSGGGGRGCSLKLFAPPEENLTKSYKFMFQKALDVREVLSWRIEELGEVLRKHHGLEDFASVRLPAQEPVTVLGQIGCDSNGKLNAKSVVLEGDREHSSGGQVPVDLSELQEYSLFPGQIVAMEGTNSTGRQLVASKIYEGVPLPFYTPPEPAQDTEQQMVLVACGPYTTSDSIAYDPLSDLVDVIGRDKPDVCILFGPFLDAKHEQVERRLPARLRAIAARRPPRLRVSAAALRLRRAAQGGQTARALRLGPLHPGCPRHRLRLDLHGPALPHGSRGDQQLLGDLGQVHADPQARPDAEELLPALPSRRGDERGLRDLLQPRGAARHAGRPRRPLGAALLRQGRPGLRVRQSRAADEGAGRRHLRPPVRAAVRRRRRC